MTTSKLSTRLPQSPKATKGEKLRADIIFFIVGCFILYLFSALLDFLFSPLKKLSGKEAEDKIDEKIREKRDKRWDKQRKDLHEDDPMEQFYLRFVDKPEEYKGDSDNEIYYAWFDQWKKGKVIDSDLKWAPDILELDGSIRGNFIQYIKIQLVLHKKASLLKRMLFTNTIFRFYPELSAGLRGLEEDIAQYEQEVDEEKAEKELKEAIESLGLDPVLAEYLTEKDINATTMRDEAQFLKKISDKGFDSEVCICALENKLTDENALKTISMITVDMGLPAKVATMVLKHEIEPEELTEIVRTMNSFIEDWGIDIYGTVPDSDEITYYDQLLDAELKIYREKRVLKHFSKGK